jgi:hypothetical protein
VRAQRVVEAVEGAGGRRRVAAQDRVLGEGLRYLPRNCDVGEEHKLFDHRVGLLEIVHRHICGVAGLRVEHEAHLGGREGEGTARRPLRLERLREPIERAQRLGQRVNETRVVHPELSLFTRDVHTRCSHEMFTREGREDQTQPDAIRRHQTQSDAIIRNQTQSDAIRRTQTHSDALRRTQWPSLYLFIREGRDGSDDGLGHLGADHIRLVVDDPDD